MRHGLFLLISLLIFSCGKKDCDNACKNKVVYKQSENENSYFMDGYVFMTTNKLMDSSYSRMGESFKVEVPDKIYVSIKKGSINSFLHLSDNLYYCQYYWADRFFKRDYCTGSIAKEFKVSGVLRLKIKGERNFQVIAKLKEI